MQIVDSTRRTRSAHRRGVVMVEFAFCLPMLLLVIALVFFFGKAMAQKLHVVEANRCDTWRHVEPSISPPTVVELNRVFFGDKATLDRQAFEGEPADVIENFVTLAGGVSQQAMALAQRTVQDSYDHGRLCSLSAEVPNTVPLWRQLHLEGPIKTVACETACRGAAGRRLAWTHCAASSFPRWMANSNQCPGRRCSFRRCCETCI